MKSFFLVLFFTFSLSTLPAVPAQIVIIRHAEKNTGDSLSTKGKERAAAFVSYFTEHKEFNTFGSPVAIYAAGTSKEDTAKYAIETVQPLAQALGLTIHDEYSRLDYKKMADEILNNPLYNNKTVLISWDYRSIPELARAFKAFQTPARWSPETYDRLWIIRLGKFDKITYQNLPQRLLYGDSSQ